MKVQDPIGEQEQKIAADITSGLCQSDLSGWAITWGPVLSSDFERTFMMYVAGNSGSGEYAVVIRGTRCERRGEESAA